MNGTGDFVPANGWPLFCAMLADAREEADRLRRDLCSALEKHAQFLEGHVIELTAAGTEHRLLVVPAGGVRDLQAASLALASENPLVHRTLSPERVQELSGVVGTKIHHPGQLTSKPESGQPPTG